MDVVSSEKRSAMMSNIKSRNTRPELEVRRVAHRLGLRFRLHRRDLPGTPDLIFPSRRTAIFVHGCYWHRHFGCKYAYNPKSNVEFWQNKFQSNVNRDLRVRRELENRGWKVITIWECETKDQKMIADILFQKVCDAAV
ncbi:very short patch repair endonuclease [uncultured Roseibium sp.]|uniref:very short patch repair endonuclease n=1 Tax=uncultured Roseibium sp. TaxID=1936171 RepID=UPI002614021D|nr:very short patch repair endonuclease [uncultured Roseibium sp.]